MTALQTAFDNAERGLDRCRKAANVDRALATSSGHGLPIGAPSLSRSKEQYAHFKGWAYTAIRAIAHRVAAQQIFVGRRVPTANRRKAIGDEIEPLTRHVLLDALNRPNRLMTKWHLMTSTIASLELAGRSHWYMTLGETANLEIWPIPADWLESVDDRLTAWRIRLPGMVEPMAIPDDELVHFTLPDPGNPFDVRSPLQAQALAIATDEQIQTAQHSAFVNGIFPQHLIRLGKEPSNIPGVSITSSAPPELTPHQRMEVMEAFSSLYGGVRQSGKPIIVDRLIEDVKKLSLTPAEMDFLESGKSTKSRILQSFGVNPLIVGEIEGANRAQAVVAQQVFCDVVVNPLLQMISEVMTYQMAPRLEENLVVWIDPCKAEDRELRNAEWDTALSRGAVTVNEYRRHVLNLADINGGDELQQPILMAARSTPKHGNTRSDRNGMAQGIRPI